MNEKKNRNYTVKENGKVSETSSFLWTMVTPVLTSTAPTGNE